MSGSSFHDRIVIDNPDLRKLVFACSGMAPKGVKGLDSGGLSGLRVSLGTGGLSALLPLFREVQEEKGFSRVLEYCRLLVHDLGTPAPAAQLLPPMIFVAIRRVVENPSAPWDPAHAALVSHWAPVLYSFIAGAKVSPHISPDEVAAVLRLLLERAEAAFPPPLPAPPVGGAWLAELIELMCSRLPGCCQDVVAHSCR